MRRYILLLCAFCSSASAATSLSRDDLSVYYDFTKMTGEGISARLEAVIAPAGVTFNPCMKDGNVFSSSGGYNGQGYLVSNSAKPYSPSCENLGGANINYNTGGMSFSVKVRDIGGAGVSLCSYFSGSSAGDASFLFSGNSVTTPGYGGGWDYAPSRNSIVAHTGATLGDLSSLGNASWQSLAVSVASSGIVSLYVDGLLFATSKTEWNRMAGNLNSIRLGANGNNTSALGDGQFSDFAIWNKALTADDAAWLANNSTNTLLLVPEPTMASLALLGLAAFGLRRRRTL